jgi:hypothetical protein
MRHSIVWLGASLVVLAGSASAETYDRSAKANARTPVGAFLGYEVDTCYPSAIPNVKIRQVPSNGTVEIRPYETELSKETRCPGRKVRGLVYVYTPKKGFKGADEFALDIPWASTDVSMPTIYTHTYRITVE